MEKGGLSSAENERLGRGTGRHWGRTQVESRGSVVRDLKTLGRMGRGCSMGEK